MILRESLLTLQQQQQQQQQQQHHGGPATRARTAQLAHSSDNQQLAPGSSRPIHQPQTTTARRATAPTLFNRNMDNSFNSSVNNPATEFDPPSPAANRSTPPAPPPVARRGKREREYNNNNNNNNNEGYSQPIASGSGHWTTNLVEPRPIYARSFSHPPPPAPVASIQPKLSEHLPGATKQPTLPSLLAHLSLEAPFRTEKYPVGSDSDSGIDPATARAPFRFPPPPPTPPSSFHLLHPFHLNHHNLHQPHFHHQHNSYHNPAHLPPHSETDDNHHHQRPAKRVSQGPHPHLLTRTKKRKLFHRFFRSEAFFFSSTTTTSPKKKQQTSFPGPDSDHNTFIPHSVGFGNGGDSGGGGSISRETVAGERGDEESLTGKTGVVTGSSRAKKLSTWWENMGRSTAAEGRESPLSRGEAEWSERDEEEVGKHWVRKLQLRFGVGSARATARTEEEKDGETRAGDEEAMEDVSEYDSSPSSVSMVRSRTRSASSPPTFSSTYSSLHNNQQQQLSAQVQSGPTLASSSQAPPLKQHLLAVLRVRLSEGGASSKGGEAGLRFKKWVAWNAWMKRSHVHSEEEEEEEEEDDDDYVYGDGFMSTYEYGDGEGLGEGELDSDPNDRQRYHHLQHQSSFSSLPLVLDSASLGHHVPSNSNNAIPSISIPHETSTVHHSADHHNHHPPLPASPPPPESPLTHPRLDPDVIAPSPLLTSTSLQFQDDLSYALGVDLPHGTTEGEAAARGARVPMLAQQTSPAPPHVHLPSPPPARPNLRRAQSLPTTLPLPGTGTAGAATQSFVPPLAASSTPGGSSAGSVAGAGGQQERERGRRSPRRDEANSGGGAGEGRRVTSPIACEA
ncbi:hypothetical protein T439DRAFT_137046 [Meredithblackwellia eburnea MCA 4105]